MLQTILVEQVQGQSSSGLNRPHPFDNKGLFNKILNPKAFRRDSGDPFTFTYFLEDNVQLTKIKNVTKVKFRS